MRFNANFTTIVNQYRVKEALRLFTDEKYSKFTISYIGTQCGFSSDSTFHRAFKKITGVTPAYYREQVNK